MMQAAKLWHGYDLAARNRILFCFTASRRSLRQRKVSPVVVVVPDVFIHEAFQMLLVQNNHMIEQVAAAVADPALGNTVLPRTSEAGPLGLNAEALDGLDHLRIEAGTAIKDQIAWCRVVRERLAQLLNHPGARRVLGHVAMQDAPPVMCNDEEAIEDSEGERRHGEEVHRRNRLAMVVQECHPPLCRFGISGSPLHPTQDSALRNIEAEHFEFSVNAGRTPGRIFGNHAEDELAQFLGNAFSSCTDATPREPRPIQLEPRPVPANNGLRLNKDQCPLPSRPQSPQDYPEQFVWSGKSRLGVPVIQDAELLTQRQVFQEQVAARMGGSNE